MKNYNYELISQVKSQIYTKTNLIFLIFQKKKNEYILFILLLVPLSPVFDHGIEIQIDLIKLNQKQIT